MSLLERFGVEAPVVQAAMGGGLSRHELRSSVRGRRPWHDAFNGATEIRRELAAGRVTTHRPLAVNVLPPFARHDWFAAAAEADAVITFWGRPGRRAPGVWIRQCGSVAEARAVHAGAPMV